jgi:hypothetical protein
VKDGGRGEGGERTMMPEESNDVRGERNDVRRERNAVRRERRGKGDVRGDDLEGEK